MSNQENQFYYICPPTASGEDAAHQVLSTSTSSSAANYDWYNALGLTTNGPYGSVMVTVEASTKDCYIRFKQGLPATAAVAATTVVNGLIIKADQPGRSFLVNPVKHGVLDVIATGTGTIQIQVSSPIGTRTKQ